MGEPRLCGRRAVQLFDGCLCGHLWRGRQVRVDGGAGRSLSARRERRGGRAAAAGTARTRLARRDGRGAVDRQSAPGRGAFLWALVGPCLWLSQASSARGLTPSSTCAGSAAWRSGSAACRAARGGRWQRRSSRASRCAGALRSQCHASCYLGVEMGGTSLALAPPPSCVCVEKLPSPCLRCACAPSRGASRRRTRRWRTSAASSRTRWRCQPNRRDIGQLSALPPSSLRAPSQLTPRARGCVEVPGWLTSGLTQGHNNTAECTTAGSGRTHAQSHTRTVAR